MVMVMVLVMFEGNEMYVKGCDGMTVFVFIVNTLRLSMASSVQYVAVTTWRCRYS